MDDFLQVILEEAENVMIKPQPPQDEDGKCGPPSSSSSSHAGPGDPRRKGSGGSSSSSSGTGADFFPRAKSSNFSRNNGQHTAVGHACKHCQERFVSKTDLNHHLQHCHMSERPFQCSHCGKSFSTKNILKQHERIHTKERPYACQYCRKTFSHRTAVVNHIRTHTGEKPYDCLYCEKSFGEKAKLLLHMRVHTGEKPFVCSHCQRAFRDKSSYNVHLRIHTGEKPFRCTYCQRCFTHRNSFKDHLRIHTGERPFVCIHCNRDFAKQSTLRKHLEVHGVVKPFELNVHAVIKPCSTTNVVKSAPPVSFQNDVPMPRLAGEEDLLLSSGELDPPMAASKESSAVRTSDTGGFSAAVVSKCKKTPIFKFLKLPPKLQPPYVPDALPQMLAASYQQKLPHVCSYCYRTFETRHDLRLHIQEHGADGRAWKFGLDLVHLFSAIMGLEMARALGLLEVSPRELLTSFLTVVGMNPKLAQGDCSPDVFLQLLLKLFMSVVVTQEERDCIELDSVCIHDLLHDMMILYPLC